MKINQDKQTRFSRRREIIRELFKLAEELHLESKEKQQGLLFELSELTTIETTLASVRKPRNRNRTTPPNTQ